MKFKYLPRVMVQEQLVSNNPRASYEVTKSISLRMTDTNSVVKASDEVELTEDDIQWVLDYPTSFVPVNTQHWSDK